MSHTVTEAGKPLRVNRSIVALLNDALAHCNMNDSGAAEPGTCSIAPEHREAMRCYLQSWVAGPLSVAIAAIEGDERAARDAKHMATTGRVPPKFLTYRG